MPPSAYTPPSATDLLAVPAGRVEAARRLGSDLARARTIALSTHINADGDGCGSEAGLAGLLQGIGVKVRVVNPTPWPGLFDFLLDGVDDQSAGGEKALRGIDAMAVLDISDVKRLGGLTDAVRAMTVPKVVIDHHVPSDEPPSVVQLIDVKACATGELVFDLAATMGWTITRPVATALYTALLTDTGGFRFSNTTPRCHAIAGYLLSVGIDPEEMYRRVYASVPLGRLQLLRDALDTLTVDPESALAWISVPAGAVEHYGLRSEDLEGIVEHPRSIAGTRMALFFRDLGHGKVKVSFRSTGDVDVNRFARQFGGGGHAKASGAMISGTLEEVRDRVVRAARVFLGRGEAATTSAPTPAGGALSL